MKIARTKNAVRNIIYGTLFKCVGIVCPFAVRTVMLYVLGSEYVGLNSLFTSVLSFLSLAELGIGSALVYSMYKPIAEDDVATVNAIYALYRRLYRLIGCIILVIGLALIPFLPRLVKSGLPADVNLYALYLVYLFNTVISYQMYAYKQSLLMAYQRSDIISKRSLIIQLSMYAVQIAVLVLVRNYYVYILWLPVSTIETNVANKIIVDKMFPQYRCEGQVSREMERSIRKKVIALFGTKANSIVLHATDNIVISAFLGLVVVARYGNYYYIMNAVIGIMTIVYSSLTAGLGNSLVTESREKNYSDFKTLSFLNAWLVMFCSVCLLCLYQPFMQIWVKEKNMFGMDIVFLLVVYFYVYQIRRIVLTYKDAAGIWWEDRFRPYVVMFTNLTLNILLCQVIGLYGIILSTVVSMLISIPWENYTVFKYIFQRGSGAYYARMGKYLLSTVCICGLTWIICSRMAGGVLGLAARLLVCGLLSNLLWLLLYARSAEARRVRQLALRYCGRYLGRNQKGD